MADTSNPFAAQPVPSMMQYAQGYQQLGTGALQQQGQMINNQQQGLNLAASRLALMRQSLGALMNNPNVGINDVQSEGMKLIQEGALTPQMLATELGGMAGMNPQQIKQQLQQYAMQNIQSQQQLDLHLGTPASVQTGNATQNVNVNRITGQVNRMGGNAAVIPNQLGPQDRSTPIQTFNNGQPGITPKGQLFDNNGNVIGAQPQQPAAPQAEGAPVTGPLPQLAPLPNGGASQGTVAPQAAPTMPMASAQGQQPIAPQAPAFIPTGPVMGAATAANTTNQGNAQMALNLQQAASQGPQRKAMLGQLETDLQQYTPGPFAETLLKGKTAVNSLAQMAGAPAPFSQDSIAAQESYNKIGNMLSLQNSALGSGTNMNLETQFHANPNQFLSKYGNQAIIGMLKGNEDAIAAKNAEWQKFQQQHGPGAAGQYGQFEQQFNTQFQPRAFQMVYMNPQERQQVFNSMATPGQKPGTMNGQQQSLMTAYINAKNSGYIK